LGKSRRNAACKKGSPFCSEEGGRLWLIQLCPAFEYKKARESADIPADATGIYRYLRDNGEIMYIGRGAIKQRLAAPERHDWTFDTVEYSVVENPDEQVKWEAHWLARYKEEHNGELPIYNRISGSREE
jgi:excinuclease UvrABC nuclease subunit